MMFLMFMMNHFVIELIFDYKQLCYSVLNNLLDNFRMSLMMMLNYHYQFYNLYYTMFKLVSLLDYMSIILTRS